MTRAAISAIRSSSSWSRTRLDAIVDEMAIALVRTAYSNNLKNAMDMSCALCDAEGRLIAQGLTLPLHLGSIPDAMAQVRRKFGGEHRARRRVHPERPLRGRHAPARLLHPQADLRRRGGSSAGRRASATSSTSAGRPPGGNGCDATEIFQEGLRIPPVAPLRARASPSSAVFELIDRNVRVPRQVLGDVRSQVAACLTGERGYLAAWSSSHGAERFAACTTALLDQAERLARNAIAAMPDGVYPFTDCIDDDGIDPDPIPIKVVITVTGDHLIADFTGSAPQVKGAINSPLPVHQVRRLRERAASDRRRPAEQRGLLPPDRGHRAAGHHRESRPARRPSPRAASPASASPMRSSAPSPRSRPTASSPARSAATPA